MICRIYDGNINIFKDLLIVFFISFKVKLSIFEFYKNCYVIVRQCNFYESANRVF